MADLTSFVWKDEPAFLTRWKYGPGEAPEDHHPAGWPRMEVHRYGKLFERGTGNPYWSVAVHSTRRARNGWTYNVAELKARPVWIAYFHHGPSGQRVQHAMSENALGLAQAFGLYRVAV